MLHPNVVPSQFPRASEDMGHKCGVCVCVVWREGDIYIPNIINEEDTVYLRMG